MQIKGVHVETLLSPLLYTPAQIDKAATIAHALHRGKLVLTEPPKR